MSTESVAALRTFDAYAEAAGRNVLVRFADLPGGLPSRLSRQPSSVVLIDAALSEEARHDELTHQLIHLAQPGRCTDPLHVLEDAVCLATARRLIPVPALVRAIGAVIAENEDAGCVPLDVDDPDTASAVALLLGTQVSTLYDRQLAVTAPELDMGVGGLFGMLTWPKSIIEPRARACLHEPLAAASPWWNWLRGLVRRAP